jgi:hypothetical protein
MSSTIVRPYRASDRDALRRICFDTALMGEPASAFYSDFHSFADMFSAYFTDHEPHNIVVAEREGRLLGYTCAAIDTRAARSPESYLLRHVFLRGVCFRKGCRLFFARALGDVLRDGLRKPPLIDHQLFPSQAHINLLPEARHDGTAKRMHCQLLDNLRAQGSRGVYAEMLSTNQAVIQWGIRKLGYHVLGEPFLIPASRGPQGERLHNVILARSLEDWQPGAWRAVPEARA